MSTLRERRLLHDQTALLRLVAEGKGRIAIEKVEGPSITCENPAVEGVRQERILAEKYILAFHCRSIASVQDGIPTYSQLQRLRIDFHARYPAEPPQAVLLSPIFHPHVWPNRTVCLGKWSPAEKLDSLVLRIASILVFDPTQFNWKSVANHEAAVWVQRNLKLFPLDDLFSAAQEGTTQDSTRDDPPKRNSLRWSEEASTHA